MAKVEVLPLVQVQPSPKRSLFIKFSGSWHLIIYCHQYNLFASLQCVLSDMSIEGFDS